MLRQWAYRDVVKYSSRSLRSASSPKAGSVTAQLAFLAKKILSGVVLMSRLLNATLDGFDVNLCVVRAFSAVRKIRAVDNFCIALYAKYESCCPCQQGLPGTRRPRRSLTTQVQIPVPGAGLFVRP